MRPRVRLIDDQIISLLNKLGIAGERELMYGIEAPSKNTRRRLIALTNQKIITHWIGRDGRLYAIHDWHVP